MDYGLWTVDLGLWTSDLGYWTSDFGLCTSDFGLWTSDFGLWTSDFGHWTSDYGLRTSTMEHQALGTPCYVVLLEYSTDLVTINILRYQVSCRYTYSEAVSFRPVVERMEPMNSYHFMHGPDHLNEPV